MCIRDSKKDFSYVKNEVKNSVNDINTPKIFPYKSEIWKLLFGIIIWSNSYKNDIEKIYLTASGGPFLSKSLKSFKSFKWILVRNFSVSK